MIAENNETPDGGEDVVTEEAKSSGGFFSSPFGRKSDPGNPDDAAQPLTIQTDAELALEAAKQEAAERTADLQRITAEYANYRKRVDRDRELVVKNAKASVLTEMLTVLDDIDRADRHGDLTGAFKAVAERLTGILTKSGLTQFGAVGDEFDPARHEAVQFATASDVTVQTVTTVMRHGYSLGDKLVRPAVVGVTGPGEDDSSEADVAADAEDIVDAEIVDDTAK